MKSKNRRKKLDKRVADFYKSGMDNPRFPGMYHKPGSNKK